LCRNLAVVEILRGRLIAAPQSGWGVCLTAHASNPVARSHAPAVCGSVFAKFQIL